MKKFKIAWRIVGAFAIAITVFAVYVWGLYELFLWAAT